VSAHRARQGKIAGKDNASAIGTLVERTTRFCLLLHLPRGKDAAGVAEAMIAAIRGLPEELRRSLTWDQGSEMAQHAAITLATEMEIFFCDPHPPWQRGSNVNGRPRKTLGWDTPAERLNLLLS
jgi:IS30 family transposase